MNWNLPRFTLRQSKLNHSNTQVVSSSRLENIEEMLVSHEYSVVSSAKFQISDFSIKQSKSFENTKGPYKEHWDTRIKISKKLLNLFPIFAL